MARHSRLDVNKKSKLDISKYLPVVNVVLSILILLKLFGVF